MFLCRKHKFTLFVAIIVAYAAFLSYPDMVDAGEPVTLSDYPSHNSFCVAPGKGNIATIDWLERSDWINVKRDIALAAKGDGVADDTKALQAALNRIGKSPGEPVVVYLPPGDYRITKTIGISRREGGMVIGHGAATRIIWDGAKGGRMFWSDGASRQTYLGMVWDGRNRAAVGIDHDSKTIYETRVMHEQMEFRNFLEAGIRVGHDQKLASAEMLFSNLKFVNNGSGVLLQEWNDYNNLFDGCQFENNGYGIRAEKGNVVVRNSRFEGSRESDLLLSTHSHSVRRVVSSGSNAFIRTVRGAIAGSLIRVQESLVSGWKSHDGAIVTDLRGPLLLFDLKFIDAPSSKAPIRLNNPVYMNQIAIVSNVVSPETTAITNSGYSGVVNEIPVSAPHPVVFPENKVFLRDRYEVPERILDVKRDCAAKGDGFADDTKKIQRCLERAASAAEPVIVYFPSGVYRVTETVEVPAGAKFQIDGTGWFSRIVGARRQKGATFHVHDPAGLRVTHLTVGRMSSGTSLLQTASKPAHVYYHNLYGYHDDERKDTWIVFDAMPAGSQIVSQHLDGRLRVSSSSAATILLGYLMSVQTVIDGDANRGGFMGILARVSALADYPLVIKDNQSLVQTDWYNEQTPHLLALEGGNGGYGKVVLDHTEASTTDALLSSIKGYNGLLAQFGGMFGHPTDSRARVVELNETKATEVLLAGNSFWNRPPEITGGRERGVHTLANTLHNRWGTTPFGVVDDRMDKNGYEKFGMAIDSFRALGSHDLSSNYCE